MRQVLFMASAVVIILGGCDTGDPYYLEDQTVGVDSVWRDSTSTTDIKSRTDLNMADTGSTTNEMRLYKSGTRIKAKVLKTADGAQAFQNWHDTELGTDCGFYPGEDGKVRCMPFAVTYHGYAYSSMNLFSDATCTKRLYYFGNYPKDCGVPLNWVTAVNYSDGSKSCWSSMEYSVYRDGKAYAGLEVFQKSSDESCSDVSESYGKYLTLTSLGEKVGPNTFVEATTAIVD